MTVAGLAASLRPILSLWVICVASIFIYLRSRSESFRNGQGLWGATTPVNATRDFPPLRQPLSRAACHGLQRRSMTLVSLKVLQNPCRLQVVSYPHPVCGQVITPCSVG